MIRKIDECNLEIFIDYFNDIIEQAIIHGGDAGGPYFVNEEKLLQSIIIFLNWTGLYKYLTIYKDDIPKLIIKKYLLEILGDEENE